MFKLKMSAFSCYILQRGSHQFYIVKRLCQWVKVKPFVRYFEKHDVDVRVQHTGVIESNHTVDQEIAEGF